jgi:hypothetical protein
MSYRGITKFILLPGTENDFKSEIQHRVKKYPYFFKKMIFKRMLA